MPGGLSKAESHERFPSSVVVIGAGVFGLSTALAISKRHPSSQVTVIDRLTPPVPDGTSVDTTRCIRSDYSDPIYARLAKMSMKMIQDDPDLSKHLHQRGMNFVCNGTSDRFSKGWKTQLEHAKVVSDPKNIIEMSCREELFRRVHGPDHQPVPEGELGREPQWNKAYCNLEGAFIDARAGVQIYYERCLASPSITFRCGNPVKRINMVQDKMEGILLEDDSTIRADMVIVAAGAWSNKLVDLGARQYPIGHEVVWFKVTAEEEERWKNMSITTNESTGLNVFPPFGGEIKVLRRSPGFKNTMTIPHPEDQSKTMQISYPRTLVTNPADVIPADAEAAIREDLREIMPPLADRPFDRTKICWISTTPTADFLIAPHPRVSNIHLATGGSAHAWKFVPVLGDIIVDSIEGTLSQELVDKFAFHRFSGGKDQNAPRMDGEAEELREVIRETRTGFVSVKV